MLASRQPQTDSSALDLAFENVMLQYSLKSKTNLSTQGNAQLLASFQRLGKLLTQWVTLHYPSDLFAREIKSRRTQELKPNESELKEEKITLSYILHAKSFNPNVSVWAQAVFNNFIENNNHSGASLANRLASHIFEFNDIIQKEVGKVPLNLQDNLRRIYFLLALYDFNQIERNLIVAGANPAIEPMLLKIREVFNKAQEFLNNWRDTALYENNLRMFFEVRRWVKDLSEGLCTIPKLNALQKRLQRVCYERNQYSFFVISCEAIKRAVEKQGPQSYFSQVGLEILSAAEEEVQDLTDAASVMCLANCLMDAAAIIENPHEYTKYAPNLWNRTELLSSSASTCKKVFGALICLVAAAAIVASIMFIPATIGVSGLFGLMLCSEVLTLAGVGLGGIGFLSGIGLMISGREKGTCSALRRLSSFPAENMQSREDVLSESKRLSIV